MFHSFEFADMVEPDLEQEKSGGIVFTTGSCHFNAVGKL